MVHRHSRRAGHGAHTGSPPAQHGRQEAMGQTAANAAVICRQVSRIPASPGRNLLTQNIPRTLFLSDSDNRLFMTQAALTCSEPAIELAVSGFDCCPVPSITLCSPWQRTYAHTHRAICSRAIHEHVLMAGLFAPNRPSLFPTLFFAIFDPILHESLALFSSVVCSMTWHGCSIWDVCPMNKKSK